MSEQIAQAAAFNGDVDDDFVEAPLPATPATPSVFDVLKAQRARIAQQQSIDITIPGYLELLALRLGPISSVQQAKIVERAQRRDASLMNADFLIAAFQAVLGRGSTREEFDVLCDEDGDPLGLDERLADKIGLGTVHSAREVLHALFANANAPDMAISAMFVEWHQWAGTADAEVDEEFLGE